MLPPGQPWGFGTERHTLVKTPSSSAGSLFLGCRAAALPHPAEPSPALGASLFASPARGLARRRTASLPLSRSTIAEGEEGCRGRGVQGLSRSSGRRQSRQGPHTPPPVAVQKRMFMHAGPPSPPTHPTRRERTEDVEGEPGVAQRRWDPAPWSSHEESLALLPGPGVGVSLFLLVNWDRYLMCTVEPSLHSGGGQQPPCGPGAPRHAGPDGANPTLRSVPFPHHANSNPQPRPLSSSSPPLPLLPPFPTPQFTHAPAACKSRAFPAPYLGSMPFLRSSTGTKSRNLCHHGCWPSRPCQDASWKRAGSRQLPGGSSATSGCRSGQAGMARPPPGQS